MSELKEFKKAYYRESERISDFRKAVFVVYGYKGENPNPRFKDVDTGEFLSFHGLSSESSSQLSDNFCQICTIEVDLSKLALQPMRNDRGTTFYRLDYEIVLMFGLTEFKAHIAYKENVSGL